MPSRSLSSPVLIWPSREEVLKGVKEWAEFISQTTPSLLKIGCFGSLGRGDWGVGSDADVVAILSHCDEPFVNRSLPGPERFIPVSVDLLIYTQSEWDNEMKNREFFQSVLWVWERNQGIDV